MQTTKLTPEEKDFEQPIYIEEMDFVVKNLFHKENSRSW